MTSIISNTVPATSLAISVSGTAYLQRSKAANVAPGVLPATQDELAAGRGQQSASQALAHASRSTLDAIEEALKKFSPDASLSDYTDGKTFSNGTGLFLHLIA